MFLFDANLPSRIPESLRILGEQAHHVHDIFAPGTPDETWINYAGARGWCIVSRDTNITRKPHERAALVAHSVGAFFLLPGGRSPTFWRMVETVIRHWSQMKRIAATEDRPFLKRSSRRASRISEVRFRH